MKMPPQKCTLPVEVSSTNLHSNSSKRPKSGASLSSKDTFVAYDKSNDMKMPPQKCTLPVEVSSTNLHSNSSKRPKSGASLSSKDTFVAYDKSN
ncbi:hypothetical protein L7F22_007180, partial [Adiantum nelumboides]|nr:hypothetical protein [Adiantum nelumboides]